MPRLSGCREENTRDKQSSSQTERDWMKKLGDIARRVWRTSPPPERARKAGHQQHAQEGQKHISRLESRAGLSPTPALVGEGPPGSSSHTPQEGVTTGGDIEENPVSQSYINIPQLEQRANNPQKGAEAGGLPKLSSGLLSETEI